MGSCLLTGVDLAQVHLGHAIPEVAQNQVGLGQKASGDGAKRKFTFSSSLGCVAQGLCDIVTISTTVATGMRRRRIHGVPPICRGSTEMRW
jgi:hypothetical protein